MKDVYYLMIKERRCINEYLALLRNASVSLKGEHNFYDVCGNFSEGAILYIHDRIYMPESLQPDNFYSNFRAYNLIRVDSSIENLIGFI